MPDYLNDYAVFSLGGKVCLAEAQAPTKVSAWKAGKVFLEIYFYILYNITSAPKTGKGMRGSHGSVGLESRGSFSFRWRISPHQSNFF